MQDSTHFVHKPALFMSHFASKLAHLRTFVLTVLATLPIRTASQGESFAFIALLFFGKTSLTLP